MYCAPYVGAGSLNSSGGIVIGYMPDNRVSVLGREKNFLSPRRPDRLWFPPSLLCMGGCFAKGRAAGPSCSTSVKNGGAVPLPPRILRN
jgi:hypothetical protein